MIAQPRQSQLVHQSHGTSMCNLFSTLSWRSRSDAGDCAMCVILVKLFPVICYTWICPAATQSSQMELYMMLPVCTVVLLCLLKTDMSHNAASAGIYWRSVRPSCNLVFKLMFLCLVDHEVLTSLKASLTSRYSNTSIQGQSCCKNKELGNQTLHVDGNGTSE